LRRKRCRFRHDHRRNQRFFGNGDGLVQGIDPKKFAGNACASYDGGAAPTSVFTEWL
jgi:hypothetical protein